jgi:hypothetical protein
MILRSTKEIIVLKNLNTLYPLKEFIKMRGRFIELEKILMKKGPLSGYYFHRKQNRKPKNQRYERKSKIE